MHLTNYLQMLSDAESSLAAAYRHIGAQHPDDPGAYYLVQLLAGQCDQHMQALAPVVEQHGEAPEDAPERMPVPAFDGGRPGRAGLLRDLQELYQSACLVDITWTILRQGAQGARDQQLLEVVEACAPETGGQLAALRTLISATAPQALLVAP